MRPYILAGAMAFAVIGFMLGVTIFATGWFFAKDPRSSMGVMLFGVFLTWVGSFSATLIALEVLSTPDHSCQGR